MNKVYTKIVDIITGTPPLLMLVVSAFLSGHLWVYIYKCYIIKKNKHIADRMLDSYWGKIAVGAIWHCTIVVVIFCIQNKTLNILTIELKYVPDNALGISLVAALAQMIIVIAIIKLRKEV